MSELPKTYDPKSVEDKLYKFWVDSGFFHAEVNPDKKPYTIVIPPPNVTGQLHMGHALDETLQDILIRYQAHAGLRGAVDAGHRPRRHRHRGKGRWNQLQGGGHRPRTTSAARAS